MSCLKSVLKHNQYINFIHLLCLKKNKKLKLKMIIMKKIIIFTEQATSTSAGSHASPLSWLRWNFEMLVFQEGGKTRRSREKPSEQDDNQRKLNPQMTPGWNWTQAILVGDKHSHDCTKPAPPPHIFMFTCIEVTIKSSPKTYLLMKQLILCLRIISTFSFIFCYKSNIKAVTVLSSISMKNLKWE